MAASVKIGVDAWDFSQPTLGVSRYLENLIRRMSQFERDFEFILYSPAIGGDFPFSESSNVTLRLLTGPYGAFSSPRELWKQVWLPYAVKRDKLDIFFIPTYSMPVLLKCPAVLTVHDILNITQPQFASKRQRFTAWVCLKTAHLANYIVVPSEHTKKELLKHSRCESERIYVTYHGCDWDFNKKIIPDEKINSICQHPYMVCVGADYPRRNYPGLINAFSEGIRELKSDFHLIIAGASRRKQALEKAAQDWGMSGRIHLLEHIDDKNLIYLYQHAAAFIYPSIYEGFGIPILEAMTAGLPVIVAKRPPMTEVAGEAGIYFEPEDPEGMKNAIKQVMQNPGMRDEYAQKSKIRAAGFSWDKAARQTLELLKRAAEQR